MFDFKEPAPAVLALMAGRVLLIAGIGLLIVLAVALIVVSLYAGGPITWTAPGQGKGGRSRPLPRSETPGCWQRDPTTGL